MELQTDKNEIIPFINFILTEKCNYSCDYCMQEGMVSKRKKSLDINASDKLVDEFKELIQKLTGKWQIRLIGGEPMLHPRFYEIAEFITDYGHSVVITTNFSLPINNYKKLVDITKDKLMSFCASLHLSQVKSIDNFIDKAVEFNNCKNKNTNFIVLSVLTEDNFNILKNLKTNFDNHNISFSFQRLRAQGKTVQYPYEIEEYLNLNPNHSAKKIERLKGKNIFGTICNAGYKSFNIQANGVVNRCYTQQGFLQHLGNIEQNNLKLLDKPLPCLAKECNCCNVILNNNLIEINNKNYLKAYYFSFLYKVKKNLKSIKKYFD